MRKGLILALTTLFALGAETSQGVGKVVLSAPGSKTATTLTTAPGEIKTVVVSPQGTVQTFSVQADGSIPVIVQLKDEPVLAKKRSMTVMGGQERAQQLRLHHERLVSTQARVKAWIQSLEPARASGVFRHYRFAFNGLATAVSPETLKKLKQHPDVARVFHDGRAQATLADSVPLIGAPQMWDTYGADGRGIRVAVIDTGIDYTHPDLGGGFGPAFKVIGGYDFVNGDADPMDDHGHGTHVAGIVAADGGVKGVAPGAKLLAYKVLGADGSGSYSTIIAGIDRAVDPDQDPTTDDGAQVINLSLGGAGDPDDAVSQAVDAAVNAGVVCVVAAGNSGSSYSTLGSPGCARKALTVGASDDQDFMASFSSRGPSQPNLAIKPDLTAPGVSIRSTAPGGGYQLMSGTSMATPHVAGAVALLLQLHPTWTPEMVKAVLAEKAKDLGQDAFTQGSGRIQVVASHLAKGVVLANNLNFGLVDVNQGIWTKSLSMRILNLDSTTKTYVMSMQGASVAGATWSFTPSSVTLGAGQAQEVTLTLTVDNSLLPYGAPPVMAYSAKCAATATDDILMVPVVFYKAAQLNISFNGKEPFSVMITDGNADWNDGFSSFSKYNPGNNLSLVLPPRNYNVACQYLTGPNGNLGFSYILKKEFAVSGVTNLSIDLDQEAIHKVSLKTIDADQHDFDTNKLKNIDNITVYQEPSWGWLSVTFSGSQDYYFSDFPSDYKFEFIRSGWTDDDLSNKYYEFKYGLNQGIKNDSLLYNSPTRKIAFNYSMDSNIEKVSIGFARVSWPGFIIKSFNYWGPGVALSRVSKYPFANEAEISILPYSDFFFKYSQPEVRKYSLDLGATDLLLRGGYVSASDLKTININQLTFDNSIIYSTTNGRISVGESPHFWTGKLELNKANGTISIAGASDGIFLPLYQGQMGDGVVKDLSLEVMQGNSLINTYTIPAQDDPPFRQTLQLPLGAYTLRVPYDGYFVNGQRAHALAAMSFDGNRLDAKPPILKWLRILMDGEVSSQTLGGRLNQLSLRVEDDFGLAQVQAYYQTTGSWLPLSLPAPSGLAAECLVDLPAGLPQGPVNLKVVAVDGTGNTLTQELTPAFYHAALPQPSSPNGPSQAIQSVPARFSSSVSGEWGQLKYTFDWGDGTTTTTDFGSSGTPGSAVHAWARSGAFHIQVRVEDTQGQISSWSEPWAVAVYAPPSIITQPKSTSAARGWPATFNVTADGTGLLTYQWRKNGAAISGATSNSYTTPPVTAEDQGAVFSVVVTNDQGSVTSSEAILTVLLPPAITTQPQDASVVAGLPVTFGVTVSGASPLVYEWWKNDTSISGATSSSYTTPPVTAADQGAAFWVVVRNDLGGVISNKAWLTVLTPPHIQIQPQSASVGISQVATFSVSADGTGPLTYQWRKNGTPIDGATSASYSTPPVTAADHGSTYSVVITNAQGSVSSGDAMLTVLMGPSIESQPQNAAVPVGQSATFSVTVKGTAPFVYQWLKDGQVISGGTSASYTTPAATLADQGSTYWVAVSNGVGSLLSNKASLTVLSPLVEIQPGAVGCFPGDAATFTAKVTNATNTRVTWTCSAGTVDDSGHFVAPLSPSQVTITATSVEDPSQKATAVVTVRGTDFDGNTAFNPKLLGLANAMGSTATSDLAKYDFNGDGRIDDADLVKLFQKMGW